MQLEKQKEAYESAATEQKKKMLGINRQGVAYKNKSEALEKELAAAKKEIEEAKVLIVRWGVRA